MTPALYVLLGHPVGHSLSPVIHNAAFSALGMTGSYEAWDVRPHDLGDVLTAWRNRPVAGANVTVPHKQAVVPFMASLSDAAGAIGAVNTILVGEHGLRGENTDHLGFEAPLAGHGYATALVLGNGGSARAVVYALRRRHGMRSVLVCGRRQAASRALVEALAGPGAELDTGSWASRERLAARADLVVNTTPLGMHPDVDGSPLAPQAWSSEQTVYDLVYTPRPTRLLSQAASAGARTIDGLAMLIGQAAASFRLWTGREMPMEPVKQAVLARLIPPQK